MAAATPTSTNPYRTSIPESDIMVNTTSGCTCFTTVNGWDSDSYDCDLLAAVYEVSVTTLVRLNSWLSGNCTENLVANLSENAMRPVCIGAGSSTTAQSTTIPSNSSAAPIQMDMASFRADLYIIQSGDSCDAIETKYAVTFAQLYAWNPAIGDDCQYISLGYAICVAVKSTSTITTSTVAPTETTTGVS